MLCEKVLEKSLKKAYGNKQLVFAETPLKYLVLPKEFVRLDTIKALCNEAVVNHNCVHSYARHIVSGRSAVYSADVNGEHLTIEIRRRAKSKLYVSQCYIACNQPCKQETLAYVKSCVEEAAPQAYISFVEKTTKG